VESWTSKCGTSCKTIKVKPCPQDLLQWMSQLYVGGALVAQWVRSLDLATPTSLSPIRRGFVPGFLIYKKGCTRLTVASDKVYQLLAHGRWFSLGTPASSTTKTGCHNIAEILLKVALKHQKSNQNQIYVGNLSTSKRTSYLKYNYPMYRVLWLDNFEVIVWKSYSQDLWPWILNMIWFESV